MTSVAKFLRNAQGASAVEFALVGSLLIFSMLFIMSVALVLYLGQALDAAAAKAARQVMIGNVQTSGAAQDVFRSTFVCANLPSIFDCSQLVVNLQTIVEARQPNGYFALVNASQTALIVPTAATAQYSPGIQQSYEYLQLAYPLTFLPAKMAAILSGGATYNGSAAVMLVSTAAFRNEQY